MFFNYRNIANSNEHYMKINIMPHQMGQPCPFLFP
jgi:hypothetical protein